MACLFRTATKPTWQPRDIFFPNGQEYQLNRCSINTNSSETTVKIVQDGHLEIQIRKNGNLERYFESQVVLDGKIDIINIIYDDVSILIWHLSQEKYDTLTQYLDITPDL